MSRHTDTMETSVHMDNGYYIAMRVRVIIIRDTARATPPKKLAKREHLGLLV